MCIGFVLTTTPYLNGAIAPYCFGHPWEPSLSRPARTTVKESNLRRVGLRTHSALRIILCTRKPLLPERRIHKVTRSERATMKDRQVKVHCWTDHRPFHSLPVGSGFRRAAVQQIPTCLRLLPYRAPAGISPFDTLRIRHPRARLSLSRRCYGTQEESNPLRTYYYRSHHLVSSRALESLGFSTDGPTR